MEDDDGGKGQQATEGQCPYATEPYCGELRNLARVYRRGLDPQGLEAVLIDIQLSKNGSGRLTMG